MQRIDRWPSRLSFAILITGLTIPVASARAQDPLQGPYEHSSSLLRLPWAPVR